MKKATVRRKKLIAGIIAGKTQKQAAIDAGYSPKTAKDQASQILSNPTHHTALLKALEKAGITDDRLAKKHADLLDAQKTVSVVGGKDAGAGGKDAGAGTVDFVDVPDSQVQVKALDLAYKLKSAYVEKVENHHSGSITFEVISFAKGVK